MRRLKSLFLILVALWLPVQAAGAVTMPLLVQGHEVPDAMPHGGSACHEQPAEAAGETGECDTCRLCHLATAGYLPPAMMASAPVMADVFVALSATTMSSHIGDPPQRPPRRTN